MNIQTLNDSTGKTSWLRAAASIWVILCILSVTHGQLVADIPANVLGMLQLGFGSLVVGYIADKVTK